MTEMEMMWETLARLERELEEDNSSEFLEEDNDINDNCITFDACSIDSAFFSF